MFTFLIVVITLIAVLLTLLVLLQSGRGGGLAGIAAGGATTQILGARQAPDVLEKGTWVLATVFILLCIATNFAIGESTVPASVIQQRSQQQETVPGVPAPTEQLPAPSEQLPSDQPTPLEP